MDIESLQHDSLTCRICLENDSRTNVISPCACSGTSKWVHRECLDKWRTTREDIAFSRCTECLTPYIMLRRSPDDAQHVCSRFLRFCLLSCQDLSVPLVICCLVILLLSLLVFGIDAYFAHSLLKYAKFVNYPKASRYHLNCILLN